MSRVPTSNGYLAKLSNINFQTIELLLGPHSVERLEQNSPDSCQSPAILQGSANVATTARIQPDVCGITERQLLFAPPQCSVMELPALAFHKQSVGIKTQRSQPKYMQGLNKDKRQIAAVQTCTSCHRCGCVLGEAGMPGWLWQACDRHQATDVQHTFLTACFLFFFIGGSFRILDQIGPDPASGESSNSL